MAKIVNLPSNTLSLTVSVPPFYIDVNILTVASAPLPYNWILKDNQGPIGTWKNYSGDYQNPIQKIPAQNAADLAARTMVYLVTVFNYDGHPINATLKVDVSDDAGAIDSFSTPIIVSEDPVTLFQQPFGFTETV